MFVTPVVNHKAKPIATRPGFTPMHSGVLQRKCTCGGTPGPSGECDACRQKCEVSARALKPQTGSVLKHDRFQRDFSDVRPGRGGAAVEATSSPRALFADVDRDETKDPPKAPPTVTPTPVDTPQGATGTAPTSSCGGKSLADSVAASDKRLGGAAVEATLDPTDFGNTSKYGADFRFSACKKDKTWRFQLDALVIPIASKVQDASFRTDVSNAADAVVTKETHAHIVRDLSPTRSVSFNVSCGGKSFEDKVTTYSRRKTYWNRQIVIDHEAFHRKNWVEMYRTELAKSESAVWGFSLPETDAKDAAGAVAKADPELTKYMAAAYGRLCDAYAPAKESRAYDAGAPAYQKLVEEIKDRATKEKW